MTTAIPTVAVIISNFNYSQFLPQAIGSVLLQTPAFDEIVVVDDGSTDNSREVLTRYDDQIVVLYTQNRGQLGACLAGLSATTSDYVYTLDADDYVAPDFVAQIRAALVKRPAKIQFQLHSVDSKGKRLGSVFPKYPPGYDAAAMRHDNGRLGFYICATTSGNVFSREALEQIDLRSCDPRGAFDGSPALAMPYLGEIISLNKPLAYYRVHRNSISGWSKPTTALFRQEISEFQKRWKEVLSVLGLKETPFWSAQPLYIRERQMMIACEEKRVFIGKLVWQFIAGIPGTHLPLRQKVILAVWASALLVPISAVRSYCIRTKRSSINRPNTLRIILQLILISK